jgi:hypothetical protein
MHQEPVSSNWNQGPVQVRMIERKLIHGHMQVVKQKVFEMESGQ